VGTAVTDDDAGEDEVDCCGKEDWSDGDADEVTSHYQQPITPERRRKAPLPSSETHEEVECEKYKKQLGELTLRKDLDQMG
jgi:hypothetical protein